MFICKAKRKFRRHLSAEAFAEAKPDNYFAMIDVCPLTQLPCVTSSVYSS